MFCTAYFECLIPIADVRFLFFCSVFFIVSLEFMFIVIVLLTELAVLLRFRFFLCFFFFSTAYFDCLIPVVDVKF